MPIQVTTDSQERWEQLNRNTGTDASAQEIKDRVERGAQRIDHGSSEGMPDPVTHENVEVPYGGVERPRGHW
jgi:hypothetical protein